MYLPDFFWKYRRSIVLLILIGFSCLIMLDSLHRRWITRVGNELVLGLAFPLQRTSESAYDGGRTVVTLVPDLLRARAENITLKQHIGQLEQEIAGLREQVIQERRLQKLSRFMETTEEKTIVARIIGADPSSWFNTIIIDKGASHDVSAHLPVVSSSGLAGYTLEVNHFSSKVLLLTDSNCRVSAIVQRSRARGVVQGDDAAGCVLKYVEPTADVKEGDVLVTSGTSHIYPKGLPVGRVGKLRNRPGDLFQWARVFPETDFERLEEVGVILRANRSDADEIDESKD